MQRRESRIHKRLEEPGTSRFGGSLKFGDRVVGISQSNANGRGQGTQDETLAAQPLQSFEDGACFVEATALRERVAVYAGGGIEVRRSANQIFRNGDGAICLAVERKDHGAVDIAAFVFRKNVERVFGLRNAL